MTTDEIINLRGKTCLVTMGKMKVECTIKDGRTMFGRDDILVSPTLGSGEEWTALDRVAVI